MLTDVKLRALKKPGKHFDGAGLYLEITPPGGRYWRLKYRFVGKEKRLAFGFIPRSPWPRPASGLRKPGGRCAIASNLPWRSENANSSRRRRR